MSKIIISRANLLLLFTFVLAMGPNQVSAQTDSSKAVDVSASTSSAEVLKTGSVVGRAHSAKTPAVRNKSKKKKGSPAAISDSPVNLPVPVSELNVKSKLVELPVLSPASFELAVSNWSPNAFSRPSFQGDAENFRQASYPWISFSRVSHLTDAGSRIGVYSLLGLATANLQREAYLKLSGGARFRASQTLSLFMARAGVEFRGPSVFFPSLRPAATVAILPALAVSAQSELEKSVSKYGLPFELTAGLQLRPKSWDDFFGLGQASAGINVQQIIGSVDGSKMDGTAVQASGRIEM